MALYCLVFCIVMLLILCIRSTNGQTDTTSSTLQDKKEHKKTIYRVPFCCGPNEFYAKGTCLKKKVGFRVDIDLKVFESEEKIYNNRPRKDVEFEPYKHFLVCNQTGYTRIPLNDEMFGLIYNQLYVEFFKGTLETFSHESFCVVYNNLSEQRVDVCIPPDTDKASVQELYFPFVVISTICFAISTAVYIIILKVEDVHRKCFVGYSISMTVTFIALICFQNMNAACKYMGGLFMFSLISSFVWLTCLCIDLICVVKSKCLEDQSRIYIYLSLCLVIPLIVVGYSVLPDGMPDVPQAFVKIGPNTCSFGDVNKETLFIPISLLISASAIGLGYTAFIINTHDDPEDFEWLYNKSHFKFMLRSCFLVWITTFIWLIEAAANKVLMDSGIKPALDLIEALQGVFVIIIFVLNKYVTKEIKNMIYKKQNREQQQKRYEELLRRLQQTECGNNTSTRIQDK